DRRPVCLGLRLVHLDSLRPAAFGELLAEPALADAGLGHHPDHAAAPLLRLLECFLEELHLLGPSDEPGKATFTGEVEAGPRRAGPHELVHANRPARALDLELAEVLELQIALGQPG